MMRREAIVFLKSLGLVESLDSTYCSNIANERGFNSKIFPLRRSQKFILSIDHGIIYGMSILT